VPGDNAAVLYCSHYFLMWARSSLLEDMKSTTGGGMEVAHACNMRRLVNGGLSVPAHHPRHLSCACGAVLGSARGYLLAEMRIARHRCIKAALT
jgi:hypothetical protein